MITMLKKPAGNLLGFMTFLSERHTAAVSCELQYKSDYGRPVGIRWCLPIWDAKGAMITEFSNALDISGISVKGLLQLTEESEMINALYNDAEKVLTEAGFL